MNGGRAPDHAGTCQLTAEPATCLDNPSDRRLETLEKTWTSEAKSNETSGAFGLFHSNEQPFLRRSGRKIFTCLAEAILTGGVTS